MDTRKSRFQVQEGIPTFVGVAAGANHFSKARRKPYMTQKNQITKEKGPALVRSARDLWMDSD